MDAPMPILFISAVSKELRSARQLVANTLTFLGYQPEWQDIFGTGDGDLRDMLRRRIDASQGVVQIVGRAFGAEAPGGDASLGRISYTQFEALYARSKGKPVWYLVLDEQFPGDPFEPEPEDLVGLQARYRATVTSDRHLYHALRTADALKVAVHEMRDELTRLRRRARWWATLVAGLLLAGVGLGVWLVHRQQRTGEQWAGAVAAITAMRQELARFQEVAPGRRHAVPVAVAADLDREQAEIEAESAALARMIEALNALVADLNARSGRADPGDEVAVRAVNEAADQVNAARAQIEDQLRRHNDRVDAFNAKMAAAGVPDR
jgi:hypothetical protein